MLYKIYQGIVENCTLKGVIMASESFDEWYSKHKEAIYTLETRRDVAFYVWANKPKQSAKTSAKSEGGYTEQFEIFWNLYPKKIGKGGAFAVWKQGKFEDKGYTHWIVKALEWQVNQQAWKNEKGKYVPNPETYLRNRRWEDEPPKQQIRKTSLGDII